MDRDELAFAGVARQAEMVRAGDVSSRELVELYLERIERLEPELNAFRKVLAERALADADQADARRSSGDERPLLGVPLAVKDTQDLAGEVTGLGTAAYGAPAQADSEFVRRLRAGGAVIVGKTNTPELAIMGTTEGPAFGVTRNPWNTEHTPGGSSGGSAAATAAGLVAGASASDGAGSIRIPASNCRLFGLKTQRGRISLEPDREHWHGLSVVGFVTRSVRDSALLLDTTVGAAHDDPNAPPPLAGSFSDAAASAPSGLRIALSTRMPFPALLDGQVRRVLDETADVLRSLGHSVERAEPAYGLASNATVVRYLRGISDEAKSMPRPQRLQRRTRGFARLGSLMPDSMLERARRDEAANSARLNRVLEDHDLILSPVAAKPPVGAAEWEGLGAVRTLNAMTRVYPYCATWNQTGQPAASVPAGFSDDGLPIGVQLIGRPNDELTLVSLAAQMEAERPWADDRPPVS